MTQANYRALVVDDDEIARDISVHGLEHEGFRCDVARDGLEAMKMVRSASYDVVITDLQMPNRHGHALAVELLQQVNRPLIVVLTGLVEPRLAKDLIARGVDDIFWKPIASYETFAAKVKYLLRKRSARTEAAKGHKLDTPRSGGIGQSGATVTKAELEARLSLLGTILPISSTALEVYRMAGDNALGAVQLASAVARDPSLAAELLRLANGAYYNPSGRKVVELEEAITRIGQKRVGELALAASASIALSRTVIPWMKLDRLWRCSLAAGVAVERLTVDGGHDKIKHGLFLSAVMHSLGRVALASLYSEQYQQMTAACRDKGHALVDLERSIFPENHAQIMSRLLTYWKIPAEVSRPLMFILDDYSTLARLPEPTRTKVELIKLAILIGKIAVDGWESWDRVELPADPLLKRLRIKDVGSILEQTRTDSESLLRAGSGERKVGHQPRPAVSQSPQGGQELRYLRFTPGSFDFLAEILKGMGVRLTAPAQSTEDLSGEALFNCLGTPPPQVPERILPQIRRSITVICEHGMAEKYRDSGGVIPLPVSYGLLQEACRKPVQRPVPQVAR